MATVAAKIREFAFIANMVNSLSCCAGMLETAEQPI
jgi:hypothetical protein